MSYSSRDYFADSSSTDEDEYRRSRVGSYVMKNRGLHGWTQWRCNLNDRLIKVMATRRNLPREQYRNSNILVDGHFLDSMTEPEIAMERRLSDFVLSRAVEDKRVDGDRLMLHPEAFISFGIPRARLQGADARRNQSSGRTTPSDDSSGSRPRRYVTYSDEYLLHG
ncbi:uncharacterized protein LOC110463312 isoform X2 [Mizuhopecten yessoensis]|uniref:Uncharacterized protein n=1 Tax=Mizuhopecten yessoensis TaxID=6573 RepID=A0A210PWG2_MIZYE|nr:uncharacterized protein LOC110463312 isoform X2 [Mizuhopecten yessoensis]OWF40813.1 hypothetical protein KP79_PYT09217 [Mizuhopecten yessoensis]